MGVELPFSPLIEIIAYCLNPNHYHFIIKQLKDDGVSKFMQKLETGCTNYFNKKNNRSGALFQGKFKAVHIDTNEYLLHLSVYVNRNDFIHGYGKIEWQYSSYLDYIGKRNGKLCNKNPILSQFKDQKEYQNFMDKTGGYFKDKREEMKEYLLE